MTDTALSTSTPRSDEPSRGRVGDLLPKAMGIRDMCAAFGISRPTFRKLRTAGEFRPFELARPIGNKRWSGEKVQAFLNGRK